MSKSFEFSNIEVICTETEVYVRGKDKTEIFSFYNTLVSSVIQGFLSTFFVPVLKGRPRVVKKLLSLDEINGKLIFKWFRQIVFEDEEY